MSFSLLFLLAGCPGQPIDCGAGTQLKGNECVADTNATDDTQSPDTTQLDTVDTVDTVDTFNPDTGPDWEEPEDPGYPNFPSTLSTLSVTIRTANTQYASTDDPFSFCITSGDCFDLNQPTVDDREQGQDDVYHFKAVGVPRSTVDRVQLLAGDGGDRWEPACIQVAFDGEPMYCNDTLSFYMGNEAGETMSWNDINLPNLLCTTCFDNPLTHGPILGMAKADDTRIWIRTDATRQVILRMWETADPSTVRIQGYAYPLPDDDFTAEFQATGLKPDTAYTYRLEVEGVLLDDSHDFRTAPADGAPVDLDLAFVSCSKEDSQVGFGSIANDDPDLLFFVGDNHYANSNVEGTLQWFYRWAHERDHRKELMMHTPTLATWVDHDYVENNTDGYSPGKETALAVFSDYWPNPAHGTEDVPGVFFSTSYGDVDFFFLDGRYYRGYDDSVLGNDQMAWLQEELLLSTATFKIIALGVQWTLTDTNDSWFEYSAARSGFFDFLRDNAIDGVAFLSGDVHFSEFRTLTHSGLYDLTDFTSSPIARESPSNCRSSQGEQVFCYDGGNSYVTLQIRTDVTAPFIRGNIHLEDGAVWAHHTIYYADLIP